MKKLKLQNDSYRMLLSNFTEWLDILGYAETMVYTFPLQLQEFFYWLEQHEIQRIDLIDKEHIHSYYQYLKSRPNEKQSGGLGKSYLNTHQQVLRKFKEYLQKHTSITLTLGLRLEKINRIEKLNILTIAETKELFEAAKNQNYEHQQYRSLVMLVLLYSCGLRRSEASAVNVSDINFNTKQLHVRKGKNYKERLIPINSYNLNILEEYIYDIRPVYPKILDKEALLISSNGKRLRGANIAISLKKLIAHTNNQELIHKNITAHSLRHSIATHLLHQGMDIEIIQQFLGHSHLETTEIYTHLIQKL